MSSKVPRGRSFSKSEIDSLLEIIEELLPIGMNEWEAVLDRHLTRYPDLDRTKDSIKRKFASLYNSKKPTGDPTCPPQVRNAKRIYNLIKDKMDLSDGEGGLLFEVDDDEDEEEQAGLLDESQDSVQVSSDTPIDAPNHASSKGNSGSGERKAVMPYRMVPASSSKRRAATAGAENSFSMEEYMKFMMVKSEKEQEFAVTRHKEKMELMERQDKLMERKDRLEERKEKRQERNDKRMEQFMQVMMMNMIANAPGHASKKMKATPLELSDNDDEDEDDQDSS